MEHVLTSQRHALASQRHALTRQRQRERECCLLVLNLVSSTLPCIRVQKQAKDMLWQAKDKVQKAPYVSGILHGARRHLFLQKRIVPVHQHHQDVPAQQTHIGAFCHEREDVHVSVGQVEQQPKPNHVWMSLCDFVTLCSW
jgi:hypothetical protein